MLCIFENYSKIRMVSYVSWLPVLLFTNELRLGWWRCERHINWLWDSGLIKKRWYSRHKKANHRDKSRLSKTVDYDSRMWSKYSKIEYHKCIWGFRFTTNSLHIRKNDFSLFELWWVKHERKLFTFVLHEKPWKILMKSLETIIIVNYLRVE